MGKIAKALHIGVKGDITITIEKRAYLPGQVVSGHVHLNITERVQGDALVLSVVGQERLNWETKSTSRKGKTTVHKTTHHKQKLELFSSQLPLAPAQQYEPGVYVHPFQCALPMDLPPTFEFKKSRFIDMNNLRARVEYKLTASLRVPGMFRADLEGKTPITIIACDAAVEPRSALAVQVQQVELLGLFGRGTCEFSARLHSDVVRIGETAHIRCKIDNQSTKRVREVKSLLYQDITVTPLKGGKSREYTYTVNKTSKQPQPSQSQNVDLEITPVMKAAPFQHMLPSHMGNLFCIAYRMRVQCAFSLCPSTKVEFPLTVLP